ncbi:hypothetical protein EIP86_004034 [Pleurotus ostreatoroseus]|nr:hypothetical protein EIP86_004034 [Pleurotus ostreatoroseus]
MAAVPSSHHSSPNSAAHAPYTTDGPLGPVTISPHMKAPPPPSLGPIESRRVQLRSDLHSIYLGDSRSILPLIGWVRHERTNVCVRAEDATTYEHLFEEYHKHPEDSEPPSLPDPVIFTAIVRLADDRFFLQSDANYTGKGLYTATFADAKMTALVDAPNSLDKDFSIVLSNLDAIVRARKTRGFQAVKGLFDAGSGHRMVKVRHVLFTPRADVDPDTENFIPPEFTIAEWPVNPKHTEAVQELATMVETHVVNYLPAYNTQGHLINPSDYERQLRGAVVALRFTLAHWSIRGRAQVPPSDSFVADIDEISVVEEPSDLVVAGAKRKRRAFKASDPFYPSKRLCKLSNESN